MTKTSLYIVGALGACLLSSASAATFFTDSLTAASGNFTLSTGGTVTYGTGGVTFSGTGDSGRSYLRTADAAYFASAFTATVTYSLPATAAGASVLFFGIGSGDVGTFYAQPDQNLSAVSGAWVGWDPRDLSGKSGRIEAVEQVNGTDINFLGAGETAFSGTVAYGPSSGVNKAVLTWNPATRLLTWTLDMAVNGTGVDETVTRTLDPAVVARWNAPSSDPSRIFFGSNNGVAVSGFSVVAGAVPEPSSLGLLGLGALALTGRRRRQGAR